MKIGIITSPFGPLPPNALGAVERLWYYVGICMSAKGHEVIFYSKKDSVLQSQRLYTNYKNKRLQTHKISLWRHIKGFCFYTQIAIQIKFLRYIGSEYILGTNPKSVGRMEIQENCL